MSDTVPTILITGGTGFAGSHLVELLLKKYSPEHIHVTYVTHIPEQMRSQLPVENFHLLDLTDYLASEKALRAIQPTQIYHLASIASVSNSFEKSKQTLMNNIQLQLNVLEIVKDHLPQARVLIVGSADGYGLSINESEIPIDEQHPFRPVNPYAVSKVTQELLAYAYGQSWRLNIVMVRPFNHIGERQTADFAVSSFAKQIVSVEKGQQSVLKVGSLSAIRDFTDVKDMVKAYELVMNKGVILETYNIGNGIGVSIKTVLDNLKSLAEKEIPIETDPERIRPLDIPVIIANNEKIAALGWKAEIPLRDTLQRVLAYWRTQ